MTSRPGLTRRRLLVAGASATLLAACSERNDAASRIDAVWHRNDLIETQLRPWLAHAATTNGAFNVAFDRRWQPKTVDELDVVAQCRLIFSFAVGYEITREARYLDVARKGADYLLKNFADPQYGGFFHSLAPDGTPKGTVKRSYDHAFALLALSELARVGQDARHREAALATWKTIRFGLFDREGGPVNEASANFVAIAGSRTQNPLMHLFEALLSLHESTGDSTARQSARQLGDFVTDRLMQGLPEGGARIPEWYDEHWLPLPSKLMGGYIDIGHQFEWSHLFADAARLGVSPVYAQVAERVLHHALEVGYDEVDGGAFKRSFPDSTEVERDKGWWQQAECLHALVVAATDSNFTDLWRRYDQTVKLVRNELIDPDHGNWRTGTSKVCGQGHCADEQPDPYHMVRLHRAALKAAGALET
jgi:mannose-6-phosphate isomerase